MENLTMEELLANEANIEYKKGDTVVATVMQIRDKQLVLSIPNLQVDAYMFKDQYSLDIDEVKNIKVNDEIKVQISKISSANDDSQYVFVSRLPLLQKELIEKLDSYILNKTNIDCVVKKVLNKGLIAYYNNVEIFIPISLVDLKQINLEDFINKTITIILIEKKESMGKTTYVGNRKEVLLKLREEKRELERKSLNVGDTIKGKIVKLEPYGALVEINDLRAILRYDEVSHYRDVKGEKQIKVNETYDMKIIAIDGAKINLSIKALIESPFTTYIKANEVGSVVKGVVSKKIPAGLIIDLAKGVSALLHVSEYSWNPNDNLDMCVKIGDELETKIIKIDEANGKISLSRKVLIHDPWKNVDAKKNDIVEAIVKNATNKGIEVVALGVDAFIPANMSGLEKNAKIEDYFASGDTVKALIYEINKAKWILTLSIKAYKDLEEKLEFEKYKEENNDVSNFTIGDIVDFKNR